MADRLLREMVAYFENWLAISGVGAEPLATLIAQMSTLSEPRQIKPASVPVVQDWLRQAIELPTAPHCVAVTVALAQVAAQLQWVALSPDYIGEQFAAGFAYTEVIGSPTDGASEPLFLSDRIAAGFSLQAPSLFYPPHYHKAVEFYGVLAGRARWQRGNEPPVWQPPGAFIFHDSEVAHAMETAVEPLLTIWAWTGDLKSPPVIPAQEWLQNDAD